MRVVLPMAEGSGFDRRHVIADGLDACCGALRQLADDVPEAVVSSEDQLRVENLIAEGVAVLAGEHIGAPATDPSDRAVLARDLWITADLVRRALRA